MKGYMLKIREIFQKYRKYFLTGAGIMVIVLVLFNFYGKRNGQDEGYIVGKTNVAQSVVLSGKVETSDRADLGFASAGRLAKIFAKNNQQVQSGQILAQLEIGDLFAELKIKQANSRTSDVDLQAARDELEKITMGENTKVESAYRTLLTEDLELIPNSNDYGVESPTIGGIYNGSEGQYKIHIRKDNLPQSDFEILTFNLEQTEGIISEEAPTALGTRGLFISFAENNIALYQDTTWFLDIPNKTSSSYLANYNAYNEAKNTRDLAIKNAQTEYQKLLTQDDGGASVAQAEIQKINAEIRKNTIYSPFNGIVTNIEKEIGENASVGERIISMVGEEGLEVVLQVSELDVSRLVPGILIQISLDAFPEEKFDGILQTVNSRDTEIDGVPVYEAFVKLESDSRVKTGMSATGFVMLEQKENVLAIPSYLVKKVGDLNFVEVILENGNMAEREVTLGLLGTDNMVEVLSGLSAGEKIVSKTKNK